MKANSGESHLLTTSDDVLHINAGANQFNSEKCEELLGILTNHKLTSEDHLVNIIQNLNKKYTHWQEYQSA